MTWKRFGTHNSAAMYFCVPIIYHCRSKRFGTPNNDTYNYSNNITPCRFVSSIPFYTPSRLQVRELLGLSATGPRKGTLQSVNSAQGAQPGGGRFLIPLSDCEFALDGFLEGLQVRHPPRPRPRPSLCCCLPRVVGGTTSPLSFPPRPHRRSPVRAQQASAHQGRLVLRWRWRWGCWSAVLLGWGGG